MASLIGIHATKNGIQQIPSRAILSLNGNGLGANEQHPDTIRILRDTRVFPDGEAPPDFNSFAPGTVTWQQYGEYWYSARTEQSELPDGSFGWRNHKEAWDINDADFYCILNEQSGGEDDDPSDGDSVRWSTQRAVDIERAIIPFANSDNKKVCTLNLGGGSPGDFEIWKEICAPHIIWAWQNGGNIYGRHAYSDKFVNDDGSIVPGQPQRVIDELEYLRSIGYGGGVILTEFGFNGGYGVVAYDFWQQQVKAYEAALLPYADILIGWCQWELGSSEFNADYTSHLKQLLPYIEAATLPRWTPPIADPPNGGNMTELNDFPRVGLWGWGDSADGTMREVKSVKYRWVKPDGTTAWIDLPLPDGIDLRGIEVRTHLKISKVDEPENPNPPPVVSNPLPQGALFTDVSANNKLVNLATLKAQGVQGVGIRLSNGIRKNTDTTDANGVDEMASHYITEAESLDMPWLGYHFSNEHYDDVAQVRHFLGIANQFIAAGHIPEMGLWIDFETPGGAIQGSPTTETRIQQQLTTLANERPSLIGDYGPYTSGSWWNGKVPNAAIWVPPLGLKSWVAAWVPESTLVNGWPPTWWKPFPINGFGKPYYWQWTSLGGFEVGHSVDSLDLNFVGDTAVVPGAPPPTPPPLPQPTIDVAPYFVPAAQYGPKIVMKVGSDTQPMQLEKRPSDVILRKGDGVWFDGKRYQDSEQWRVKDGQIQKGKDTSDAGNGGRDGYDLGWMQWIPQFVAVGETYHSTPTVKRFDRTNNCQVYSTSQANDYLHIKKIIPTWVSPANSSIVLNDVLVIEWRSGTPDLSVPPNETYYFAKGIGYVGWGTHFIVEITQGQAPLTGALDCGM